MKNAVVLSSTPTPAIPAKLMSAVFGLLTFEPFVLTGFGLFSPSSVGSVGLVGLVGVVGSSSPSVSTSAVPAVTSNVAVALSFELPATSYTVA